MPAHLDQGVPGARRQAAIVRSHISSFIIQQLEATPETSAGELQARLRTALCFYAEDCDGCTEPPVVLATDWGPRSTERQVVVAYALSLGFMGPDLSVTVIENYIWRPGTAKRTSSGGREFDGHSVEFEPVTSGAGEYWLLAWGTVSGSSGRGVGGRAAVYRVGADAVEVKWLRSACNVHAQANAVGWEVSYVDCARLYADQPRYLVLDIYAFDPERNPHSRVVRYRY